MKLINSKSYKLKDLMSEGQCSYCGKLLQFNEAKFEELILAYADCCNWTFILMTDKNTENKDVSVSVIPNVEGIKK